MSRATAVLTLVLTLMMIAAPSAYGGVPTYSVVKLQARANIVDGYNLPANSTFNSKTPALNDAGTIAFSLIAVGGNDAGLFMGSDGTGAVVYSAPDERLLEDPSLNTAGAAAFDQADLFSDGIFVYDPVSGQTTQAVAPITFSIAGRADITDGGAIGYRASAGGPQSWRMFDAGTETVYAAETAPIAFLFTPSTNDSKRIAGKVRLSNLSGSAPDEIRVYSGPGAFTVIAQDVNASASSPYAGFDNGVYLANDGRVAFVADLVAGGRGVFLGDGTTTTTIATVAHPAVSEVAFFRPIANTQGLVAFRGRDRSGLYAIFVGNGSELRRVIGEHDLVPSDLGTARIDQHDNSVVFGGSIGLNLRGDIAFNAALTPENNNQIEWGSGMYIAYADGTAAPPPVPDGDTVPGSPLRAGKAGGIDLVVTWDATTCPADDYNLFLGDIAEVATLPIDAAECGLGTSGTATFTPPAGDVFFLIAAENARGVESGHGFDGEGNPRPSNGVGLCGIVEQALDGICP